MNRCRKHILWFLAVILLLSSVAVGAEAARGIMYWRPYFGARFGQRGGLGIRVTHVAPGSPADSVGIGPGDVVYEFADKDFYKRSNNPEVLRDAILLAPVDKPVKVVFLHSTEKKIASVQLRRQPFLGIMFSGHEGQGFLVREILQNAPAGELDIQKEDLIIGYGGKSFTDTGLRSRILADEISKSPFNTPITLRLLRKGKVVSKTVVYESERAEAGVKSTISPEPVELAEPNAPKMTATEILLIDDFNTENAGKGRSNYRGFAKWRVTRGEVDLIGNGFFDHQPGNGLYIDLDGSKAAWSSATVAGHLTSKQTLALTAGTYILKFDLAGHPYQGPNTVIVKLADIYRADFTLDRQTPATGFKTYSRTITVEKPTTGNLIFEQRGGDYSGLLLDNVSLIKATTE